MALAAGLAFYLDAAALTSVAIALPIWRDVYALTAWQVGLVSGGFAFAVAASANLPTILYSLDAADWKARA